MESFAFFIAGVFGVSLVFALCATLKKEAASVGECASIQAAREQLTAIEQLTKKCEQQKENVEFGLVRAFGIDDGQLSGLSDSMCFVLGYELALFDESLKRPDGFEMLVHAENQDRIKSELVKSGRKNNLSWMNADSSESWLTLVVDGVQE